MHSEWFPPPTLLCSAFALQMRHGTQDGVQGGSVARRHRDQGAVADGETSWDSALLARHGKQAGDFALVWSALTPRQRNPFGGAAWLSVIGRCDVLMDANDGWPWFPMPEFRHQSFLLMSPGRPADWLVSQWVSQLLAAVWRPAGASVGEYSEQLGAVWVRWDWTGVAAFFRQRTCSWSHTSHHFCLSWPWRHHHGCRGRERERVLVYLVCGREFTTQAFLM